MKLTLPNWEENAVNFQAIVDSAIQAERDMTEHLKPQCDAKNQCRGNERGMEHLKNAAQW